MLQGLSGVGPALAQRLLIKFGSVERVVTADEESLNRLISSGSSNPDNGKVAELILQHGDWLRKRRQDCISN